VPRIPTHLSCLRVSDPILKIETSSLWTPSRCQPEKFLAQKVISAYLDKAYEMAESANRRSHYNRNLQDAIRQSNEAIAKEKATGAAFVDYVKQCYADSGKPLIMSVTVQTHLGQEASIQGFHVCKDRFDTFLATGNDDLVSFIEGLITPEQLAALTKIGSAPRARHNREIYETRKEAGRRQAINN
jgi:hypothetical protein